MRRVWGWAARNQFLTAIVLFSLIVAGAFARDTVREADRDRFVGCVAQWADDFTARTTALDTVRGARDEASDMIWRDFRRQLEGAPDRDRFSLLLTDYVTASDSLKATRRSNPIPDPPRIRC